MLRHLQRRYNKGWQVPFDYSQPISPELYAEYKKYYDVFTSPNGKDVFEDLIQAFDNRESYVQGDSYATHFRDGQRSVVLGIKKILYGIEHGLFQFIEEGE